MPPELGTPGPGGFGGPSQPYSSQPPQWGLPPPGNQAPADFAGSPPQPLHDPNLPWWHPAQPQSQYGSQSPPYGSQSPPYGSQSPPYGSQPLHYAPEPPRRRTGLRRLTLALAVVLAFAMTFGGLSYFFPRVVERVDSAVHTPAPSETAATTPRPSPTQTASARPNRPRAAPAQGVTAAESAGVVLIAASTTDGISAGSGMVISPDGKVLTNYHVVAGSESVDVTVADTDQTFEASVLGFDQGRDIALLQISGASDLLTVTIDSDSVELGDSAAAVGNANGGGELVRAEGEVVGLDADLTVTSGSPWGAEEDLKGLIVTSAGAVPGHSGGPMFDADTEVIGITTAGSPEQGTSFAVPIAEAMRVVAIIEAGRDQGTVRVGPAGYLGVQVGSVSQAGATVTEVVAGGPAEGVGIERGAILTRIGQTRIDADTNMATAIRSLEPGDEVIVAWLTPSGGSREATVVIGASPVN